jgi:serine/threonine protein kinase
MDGDATFRPGNLLDGRYRLDRIAGEGAFGVVYEAHHLALDTRVAIKLLRAEAASPSAVGQFLSEARTLGALRHPAIVRVLDAGVSDGKPYFVMEWCDGPTLAAHLEETGPLGPPAAWALLEPVFDAIAHAHAKGIVHRDVKPSNVVLYEGSARVIDFGIAKVVAPDEVAGEGRTTTLGQSFFTPKYAAPEQLAGARTGPWTDVYALALLFTEAVGGAVKGPLEPVFAQAMARRPADRFADAGELVRAVREAMVPRRRPWLLAFPAVAVGGALVALYHFGTKPHAVSTPVDEHGPADAAAASVASAAPSVTPSASAAAVALAPSAPSSVAVATAPVGVRTTVAPSAAKSVVAAGPAWAFSVNGYENGGFIQSTGVQAVTRAAWETKSCFPEPTADALWNAYLVFQWPKGRPRELRIEVKRGADVMHDAVADGIASCLRGKFDAASIPDADGQDDLPTKTSYDKLDVGYFPLRR